MSKMSEKLIEIAEMIQNYPEWSFQKIADHLQVPVSWVYDVAEDLGEFDE